MAPLGLWVRSIVLGFFGLIVTIALVSNYSAFGFVIAAIIDFLAIRSIYLLIERNRRMMEERGESREKYY